MKHIKTITSYTGNARFFAELSEEPIGFIPRQPIESPYVYSPTHCVWDFNGTPIIEVETKHKYYKVFDVSGTTIYKTDDEAMDVFLAKK